MFYAWFSTQMIKKMEAEKANREYAIKFPWLPVAACLRRKKWSTKVFDDCIQCTLLDTILYIGISFLNFQKIHNQLRSQVLFVCQYGWCRLPWSLCDLMTRDFEIHEWLDTGDSSDNQQHKRPSSPPVQQKMLFFEMVLWVPEAGKTVLTTPAWPPSRIASAMPIVPTWSLVIGKYPRVPEPVPPITHNRSSISE